MNDLLFAPTITSDPPEPERSRTSPLGVAHVLNLSLPVMAGYSFRSQALISGERSLGMAPVALTSPLHHVDDPGATDITVDGIPYLRTPIGTGLSSRVIRRRWPVVRELTVVHLLEKRIEALLKMSRIEILHAHSPALCGLAGLRAARKFGIPFVYEIRAFWEDAAVDQIKTRVDSYRYSMARRLETYVVHRASAVVGIATGILDDLASRGIKREKLFHVPNGVDAQRFQPLKPDRDLSAKLNPERVPVIGFIGSLYRFEGVPWLIRAAAELRRREVSFKLLILGQGEDAAAIRQSIQATGTSDCILFLGKVPHSEISKYYSIVDVMIYPRLKTRTTDLVTPLKPLEAMAQGKPVLASAVGGHRELVTDEYTGLLFTPMDIADFCRQAQRLLTDLSLRHRLSEQARTFVLKEKDWKLVASRYLQVYEYARRNARQRNPVLLPSTAASPQSLT